jgi:VCBS repeat-containing protein
MPKKRLLIIVLSILVPSIIVASILVHQGQEPSDGGIAEVPADTTPSSSNTSTPSPSTPSTLTMLSITEGDVFVMKAGTDSWTEAQVGMSLEAGDSIKTDDSSNAEITFFDGSTIELQAGTEIEVASLDISTDTGSTTISLKQAIGTTISRVTNLVDPASSYQVETAAGVAGVRGSVLTVQVIEDGTTWITNQKGNIYTIAQGVKLQIPEGRQCFIRPGKPPKLIPLASSGSWQKLIIRHGKPPELIPMNDPPIAANDSAITDEDTPLTVAAPGVLNNDSDPDVGDTLSVTTVDTSGTLGSVTAWNPDGSFTYDPDGQFEYLRAGSSTTDSFTYTISDGLGSTDTATVTITINGINDAPTGINLNNTSVAENQPPGTAVSDFSTTDPDTGDTFTYSLVSGDGDNDNASFTIADSQLQTVASFDYETKNSYSIRVRTTDSGTLYYEQAFSITVINVNDPPVAANDIATTVEDTSVTIDVLNNDFDANGDTLTVDSVTQGTDGSVINNGNDVTYTPYLGFSGTDSFTYTISDGNGGTDTATVTVIVTVTIIEKPARINIQIDTGPTASIFIWDNTTNHWAIDEDADRPVNGANHSTSDTITVAGRHYLYVWLETANGIYHVKYYPNDWSITSAPVGDAEAVYGYSAPDSFVHFCFVIQ